MNDFKQKLCMQLCAVVQDLYENAKLISCSESENGFHCDFSIAPLNPSSFEKVKAMMQNEKTDCYYELESFSGVYEDGDSKNQMLQRIYVVAFEKKNEMESYKEFVAEASKCDHKLLGSALKLFSSSSEVGQGLILWNPKGAMLRYALERFGQSAHLLNDYEWVYTPHIGRSQLWRTSGHLDFYKDSMYSPIVIDEEEYFLKPMNCPFHIEIYNSESRSYRDLPIKYAEYGTVYRYELSGALNGLTRVRGFTQDDAHIICTPQQVSTEVENALKFSLYILRSFGLDNFDAYISTKPKSKFIGDDNDWEMATEVLKNAVVSTGLEYKIDEGGGAFYGPKIDLKLRDGLNRQWQCSTIQFDFNLPNRFKMSYVGSDGQKHAPFMIHRALFGSFERFIALLIEHYKGDFPLWFAPLQIGVVPIKADHVEYAKKVTSKLRSKNLRVRINTNDENIRGKIKGFELEKVPFVIVIGDKEVKNDSISVRSRKGSDLGSMSIDDFYNYIEPELQKGVPKRIID